MSNTTLVDRAVIRLSGEDVRGFLQGLVTNDVTGPLPAWAGLLTAQGKALFDFLIWSDGDDLLLDCEAEQADALARRLTLYRLRRKIAIARDDGLAVHWSSSAPAQAGAQHPANDSGLPPAREHSDDPRLAALGKRWIAAPGAPAQGWHAHRLTLGVTEGVAELGQDKTLWLECNAAELNGVSFSKGCYVGQENTARMNWRQKVNRRLVVVPLDRADPTRQRIAYPELGLSVEHRRVEDLAGLDLPDWLAGAIAAQPAQ